jgi:sugar phosphate isomerase/epimerase
MRDTCGRPDRGAQVRQGMGGAVRVSVSQASSLSWGFEQDLESFAALGVRAVTVLPLKIDLVGLDVARRAIERSGLRVAGYGTCGYFALHDPARLAGDIEVMRRHLVVAGELGADTVTIVSGSGGGRPYRESEARFRWVVEQILPDAERANVVLTFENTAPMRVDLGFVHTFHDALDLVASIDSSWFKACLELNNAWMERFLYGDIAAHAGRIGLVQVNDFAEGTRTTPDRVPLGDGIIPLDRIFEALISSGYAGWYEIEQVGPDIERLGYEESIRRSLQYFDEFEQSKLAAGGPDPRRTP